MKRLLIVAAMVAGLWVQGQGQTVAIIVEDNTSRATIGVDTLLGDFLNTTMGYTVHYRDIDTVQTSAYWNGAGYSKIIVVGNEVALPSPTGNVDSIAASTIPFLVVGSDFWDEVNLGSGKITQAENAGYIINIGQTHWITRVLQDTVLLWGVTATGNYSIVFPDTAHSVTPLLIDKDSKVDTGAAIMAVCEAGATIINTGDGRNVANQRRVFFGSWQYQAVIMDSCQFWTAFGRAVAWLDGDTANAGVMAQVCFSGKYELDQSCVVENSSGTDSLQCHGVWDDLYTGWDWDAKHFFIKPRGIAVTRKLASIYRSVTVNSAVWKMRLKAKAWDITPPATYYSAWSLAPLRRYWNGGDRGGAVFDSLVPYACWTYRYGANVSGVFTSYPWEVGGAQDADSDMVANYIDTLFVTQDSTIDRWHYLNVDTVTLNTTILDTSLFQGWVANTLDADHGDGSAGVETAYYSVTNSSASRRPTLSMAFSSWSITDPVPSIAIAYDSLTFTATEGGSNPASQVNTISNSSGGALACQSFSKDSTWLTLTTYDEGTPYQITNTISMGGRPAGYYSEIVTIQCDDADNTPQTYKVALTIESAATPPPAASVEKRTGLRKQ